MEDAPPRIRFISLTFLLGFGFGSFIGVALALLAIAIVNKNSEPARINGAEMEALAPTSVTGLSPTLTPQARPRTKSQLDVRLGPGLAFAIVGLLNRGEAIQVTGRDFDAGWVSIQFPPGSTGMGWVPVADIEGITEVSALSVVLPTPLARTLPSPTPVFSGSGATNGSAVAGANGIDSEPTARVATSTPTPMPRPSSSVTPTAQVTATPVVAAPTDLVVTRIGLTSDRRVSITIGNRGPGALVGQTIFVLVRDLAVRSEQLVSPNVNLSVGGTITLVTQYLELTGETDIQASVDPSTSLRDPDRSNNVLTTTLRPPLSPTSTPVSQRED